MASDLTLSWRVPRNTHIFSRLLILVSVVFLKNLKKNPGEALPIGGLNSYYRLPGIPKGKPSAISRYAEDQVMPADPKRIPYRIGTYGFHNNQIRKNRQPCRVLPG